MSASTISKSSTRSTGANVVPVVAVVETPKVKKVSQQCSSILSNGKRQCSIKTLHETGICTDHRFDYAAAAAEKKAAKAAKVVPAAA